MDTQDLSTTMHVFQALFVADYVCDHCCIEVEVQTVTNVIDLGYGPDVIVPEIWCRKCGSRELTQIIEADEESEDTEGLF